MAYCEKDLVHRFVRDLDEIELPPRDRWRPSPRKESYFVKTSRFVLSAAAVAAVVILALLASSGLRERNQVGASPSPTSPPTTAPTTPSPSASASASSSPQPTASQAGTITGNLGYPSDFIPPLTVYAISVADQRVFFSVDTPRYGADPSVRPTAAPPGPRPSYTITGVAPGTYYVLGWRNDNVNIDAKNTAGVYSQFVLQCIQVNESHAGESGYTPPPACGSPGDHTLVPVTVQPGETVSRIDVTDWYYQQQANYPPRPR